jgi:Ser/Thr protein kinase RdoA (MazF antagonist)
MQEIIDELVGHFFEDSAYDIKPVPFGLTNQTRILTVGGQKYVLRIYNPHTKNVKSLNFETQLTSYLSSLNLSFAVPEFLNTPSKEHYVRLSDGTLGAVVSFIEGTVPEITSMEQAAEFGAVVGELSLALHNYPAEPRFEGIPFTEIYRLHPLADERAVDSFMENPPFELSSAQLQFYRDKVSFAEKHKSRLQELPKQLVHHDVLIYNLLSKENRIHGVLDFDFTSLDTGFMEFAISLNHILELTNGSWEMAEAFIKGYSRFRKCTSREMDQLQLLTDIYHLDLLHIYIGQHYSGRNVEQNFIYILHQFQRRSDWLNTQSSALNQLLARNSRTDTTEESYR